MKSTRYILLIIGLLGIIASVFNFISGQPAVESLITFVCSAALITGYWELGKKLRKEPENSDR